MLSFSGDSYVE